MRSLFRVDENDPPRTVSVALVLRRYAKGTFHDAPTWMLDEGNHWIAFDGETWAKDDREPIVRRAEVSTDAWEAMEWADTDLVWQASWAGWLAPDGTWTGCGAVWHDVVAQLVLRREVGELERTYARVYSRGHTSAPSATGKFTPAQAAWLRLHGHEILDTKVHEATEVERMVAASGRPLRTKREGD